MASLVALLLMFPPARGQAADPLTEGRQALKEGRYADARLRLTDALIGPTRAAALLALGDLELLTGQPAAARQVAAEADLVPGLEASAQLLTGRALAVEGRYPEALAAYRQAVTIDPEAKRARVLLGELLLYLGRKPEARRLLEPLVAADWLGGHATPADLVSLGRAAILLGKTKLGFDALDQATTLDSRHVEAQLELGRTALGKEDLGHAAEGFQAVLAVNPHHPDALVGLGAVLFLREQDYTRVEEQITAALAVHPVHPGALRLRAAVALSDQDGPGARRALEPLLRRNPSDLEALALLAAACELEDDLPARRQVEARIKAIHPQYAPLWDELARMAERAHRYPEAVEHARRSLAVDPDYFPALRRLGFNLTRTGREEEGRRILERSYRFDDYQVTVVNLLNLFEHHLQDYRVVSLDGGRFRLRGHRRELVLLELFAGPLLAQTAARYRRSYGFDPPRPLAVEIFHEPDLFGVRSVGLPAVASHGISFGRLVTARSPATNDFNWAQVLVHELSHVYGLQLSRYRVPRWLTEGLAEYETTTHRPEWSRHRTIELYHALKSGRLRKLEELNRGFTHARNFVEVDLAYQQAALVTQYLCEVWGYAAVIRLHQLAARSRPIGDALREVTGKPLPELDRGFLAWLTPRLRAVGDHFTVDEAAYLEGGPLRQAVAAQPEEPQALAGLAAHLLWRQPPDPAADPAEAYTLAQRALTRAPQLPLALYVAGEAAVALGRATEAQRAFQQLQQQGQDGPSVAFQLGRLAQEAGDLPTALRQLRGATTMNPEATPAFRLLARAAEQAGDPAAQREALERLCLLDQHDPLPPLTLGAWHLKQQDPARGLHYGQLALHNGLFLPEVHLLLTRVQRALHQPGPALRHATAAALLLAEEAPAGPATPQTAPPPSTATLRLETSQPLTLVRELARELKPGGGLSRALQELRPILRRQPEDEHARQVLAVLEEVERERTGPR